ncbi:hypothetical protein CBR_g54040 [Chara braunii]|uniref:Thioesterase domain-containing protein n=1 Tax=Chara braunii TaxID=69332 RepID=A0A388MBK2_CHABU|nr:hypothetical protein CBR_g54040 [Chara braunii]|eukprot:GBG91944.1 hypothetical protein CBR_g54040 [Chara braunii]
MEHPTRNWAADAEEWYPRMGNLPIHAFLGITFEFQAPDVFLARMKVTERAVQPWGLLHGGVSAVLVEAIASSAAAVTSKQRVAGLEISVSHLRPVPLETNVIGVAKPLLKGKKIHVWEVRIEEDVGQHGKGGRGGGGGDGKEEVEEEGALSGVKAARAVGAVAARPKGATLFAIGKLTVGINLGRSPPGAPIMLRGGSGSREMQTQSRM